MAPNPDLVLLARTKFLSHTRRFRNPTRDFFWMLEFQTDSFAGGSADCAGGAVVVLEMNHPMIGTSLFWVRLKKQIGWGLRLVQSGVGNKE